MVNFRELFWQQFEYPRRFLLSIVHCQVDLPRVFFVKQFVFVESE